MHLYILRKYFLGLKKEIRRDKNILTMNSAEAKEHAVMDNNAATHPLKRLRSTVHLFLMYFYLLKKNCTGNLTSRLSIVEIFLLKTEQN